MALTAVPPGHCAAIVTHLEMTERPRPQPLRVHPLRLVAWPQPDLAKYRTLFSRVGTPWLWFSRTVMPGAAVAAIIGDPAVEVYAVADPRGIEVGILELDFREPGNCEIGYFGLVPELNGNGHGRWLMGEALARAWRKDVTRVWVHTCSLDHPSALNFYRAQGFVAFKREIETFPDPRLTGHLPRNAAPQVPILS
ncbi:GNAT family N-acetyltransferase [Sphingomonas sp. SUN039]|uniref:GNAT family N-acetyltransferase n=1 Tax=Sphingomonas sp. SUN039 TaxID=2937787 RepID=UPI0021647FAF|nr:GNAT family N-acetyltransferase [Sphingomonas sp. SUN039]UVO53983.1 GNAT family N-acetyltransferase [Sphingomonas sp. SUN039]